jgi:glycosyltransferase involved in cell wall biosynthesis
MPDMPRVLFVTSSFPRWHGDSTTPFILHLAEDLVSLGWHVTLLAPHAEGARRHEHVGAIEVHRFRYFWPVRAQSICYGGGALANLRRSPLDALKLPALVAAEWWATMRLFRSVDLVHSHWILPQGAAVAMTPARHHVATVHGSDVFGLQAKPFAIIKGWALRRASAVTANSTATKAKVSALTRSRVNAELIPMGVDIRQPDPEAVRRIRARFGGSGPLVVFLGRIVEEKGVLDLVRAFALIRVRFPMARLTMVGGGIDSDTVSQLAVNLGLDQVVDQPGWTDPSEVVNWFTAADVVAVPSWFEAQGLSVMEAQAAGAAVVATSVGGIPDAIEDGGTGILVEPRDPEALAAAVILLLDDPARAAAIGEQAAELATRRFSRQATAMAFDSLYNRVLAR